MRTLCLLPLPIEEYELLDTVLNLKKLFESNLGIKGVKEGVG